MKKDLNKIASYLVNNKFCKPEQVDNVLKVLSEEFKFPYSPFECDKNCIKNDAEFYSYIRNLEKAISSFYPSFNQTQVDNKVNEIFGLLIPSQDELDLILQKEKNAFDYLLNLSLFDYYVKKDRLDSNIKFTSSSKYGELIITINKSKPEKTPEEIKKAKENKDTRCLLCIDNIGYKGSEISDSRENLRVEHLNLNGRE